MCAAVCKSIVCDALKSLALKMNHQDRLRLLGYALRVPTERVVAVLRAKDVLVYGPGGALLFACGDEWPDERLVEAAVNLFINDDTPPEYRYVPLNRTCSEAD